MTAAPLVAVRAPNWLGDTVMALPALRALRDGWPGARVTVVGPWAGLLSGQRVADVLLPYPQPRSDRRRLDRALAAERPDVAILFPSSLSSAFTAWRWRARRRLGFDTDGRGALLTDRVTRPEPRRHQVDEYASLLEPLGIDVADPVPAWALRADAAQDAEVDALLGDAGLAAARPLVGVHLGAAFGPSKLWPLASFGRLAERLDAARLTAVLLGSPADADTAAAVAAAASRPPASLVGRDRPALLPRLLSRLACVVSGDTGIAHLAAAVGVPTVTLFGPTDPRLTAPRGPGARCVSRPAPCSPCFLAACPIEHVCLRAIAPEEVALAVERACT